MKLVTRKSECKRAPYTELVKTPKDAIRRTLNNYIIKDGLIIRAQQPSYVSREEMVLRNAGREVAVKLGDRRKINTQR